MTVNIEASRTWSFLINVNLLQTQEMNRVSLTQKKMNSRRDSQFHEGAEVMKYMCVCVMCAWGVWMYLLAWRCIVSRMSSDKSKSLPVCQAIPQEYSQ